MAPSPQIVEPDPQQAPYTPRVRLVYVLLAAFSFIALVPLCLAAWGLIGNNKEALKTSQQEFQHLLAGTIAGGLRIHMENLENQVVRASRALARGADRPGAVRDAEIKSDLLEASDEQMIGLRFMDLRGGVIDAGRGEVPRSLEPVFQAGFRQVAERVGERQAAHDPAASEVPVISPPFAMPGSPPRSAVLIGAPVISGSFRGVLLALVDLNVVWNSVIAGRSESHAMYAVDREGRLLASTNLGGVAIGDSMKDSPVVSRFLQSPGRTNETMPFDWAPRSRDYHETYMGSYALSAEGWGVFVHARERDVYNPVSTMIASTLKWALLALGFALVVAVLFVRVLAGPIKRLADASRAIARGDFKARVEVRSLTEVGELSTSFNSMASKLENLIADLKKALQQNKQLFGETVRALASAIDAKDPYTRGHSVRVHDYSLVLARHLGLEGSEVEIVKYSSLLHDVGKIGVPDQILKKAGHLEPDELAQMKKHPEIGEQIMRPIRQMKAVLPGLRNHHERWEGGGYPDGQSGEAIPLLARIIAVADTFDAMTTDRPYQKGMTFDDALARLNALKGHALDPRIVEAFNRAYRAGDIVKAQVRTTPAPSPEPAAV